MTNAAPSIVWPERFHPARAPVHVRNELDMAAHPEKVWAALIDAARWPEWYPNAANVRILSGDRELAPGARFRWTTFGATIVCMVWEVIALRVRRAAAVEDIAMALPEGRTQT